MVNTEISHKIYILCFSQISFHSLKNGRLQARTHFTDVDIKVILLQRTNELTNLKYDEYRNSKLRIKLSTISYFKSVLYLLPLSHKIDPDLIFKPCRSQKESLNVVLTFKSRVALRFAKFTIFSFQKRIPMLETYKMYT